MAIWPSGLSVKAASQQLGKGAVVRIAAIESGSFAEELELEIGTRIVGIENQPENQESGGGTHSGRQCTHGSRCE